MTPAQRFAELNGIEPTYKFLIGLPSKEIYPTFQDAKSILEVMMGREDWHEFVPVVGIHHGDEGWVYINIVYIDNPDKLLEVCIKWCESHLLKEEVTK